MRDHGGDLDAAVARFGGKAADWIDLSTGINTLAYPVPKLPPNVWGALPTKRDYERLIDAAQVAFKTNVPVLPVAGAQAAIQLIPRLWSAGHATVFGPTYNEHAAALRASGWQVHDVRDWENAAISDLAVIVNPNNPDGHVHSPKTLLALAERFGRLVVDESFIDPTPSASVAPMAGRPGMLILRSFGKFYGLAGVRLGFVIGASEDIERLREMAGPWAVSGPALAIGIAALTDTQWALQARTRLFRDAQRLDGIACRAGWRLVGGTALFRLYETSDAIVAQRQLARDRIWSRIFPWSPKLVRLGIPGSEDHWQRLARAITDRRA